MKVFIGLVGEKGSGKDTFAEILRTAITEYSVARVRSSDILAKTLDLWSLPKNRRNLQQLAIVMEQGYGPGTLTRAITGQLELMKEDIVIFDAIRWKSDLNMVRSFPNNVVVYITADAKLRYERSKARKEKIGEATATFEQFLEEEKVSTETEIPSIGQEADIMIENSDTVEQFKAFVVEFYQQKVRPILERL